MSYNVLIIGCGNKGALSDAPGSGNEHKFLSYAHAVKDHPGFEHLTFMDADSDKSYQAVKTWGGMNWFYDKDYIAPSDTDIAIVCTPDETHYDILKQLSEYPLKLVICEKPLCTDLQQAREIVELYRQKNIPILVDYTRRFIPEYQQIKAEIDSGKWGKFLNGFCYFNRGWLHTASHFIDMALWFNGSLDKIMIQEVPTDYRWVYQWGMFYEKDFASENAVNFVKNPHVDTMYDKHLWYVMDNAYNFLEGKEPLLCTGEDALRALEECYRAMDRSI
jgi:predicted dehydrogenase